MHTPGGKGTFEWWYTDANFDDGTTVVAIWFTKNYFDVAGPACRRSISRSRSRTARASIRWSTGRRASR